MKGAPPRPRRLSWHVHAAWAAAWLASSAVFTLVGAAFGGDNEPLGATVPVVGTAAVFFGYMAVRFSPEAQPARATFRALARVLVWAVPAGVAVGYAFHSLRLR